jgi:hypothetical protein
MSTAGCLVSDRSDVWLLANATVYEAREVATEFNEYSASFYRFLKTIEFIFVLATSVFPGLRRIAAMQDKLIAKLESAKKENWSREDCSALAALLRLLVWDERNFIDNGLAHLWPGRAMWIGHTGVLRNQLNKLEDFCLLLEALSVPENPTPGDADCQEFMVLLSGPEEYDFSTDPGVRRRVPSHA